MTTLEDKTVITRKKHKCSACGRKFPAGTKMRTCINLHNRIFYTWRECPTCQILLSNHRKLFTDTKDYNVCFEDCVLEYLEKNQTPEELLKTLQ